MEHPQLGKGSFIHVVTIDFPHRAGFVHRISKIAERAADDFEFSEWQSNAQRFQFEVLNQFILITINSNSLEIRARDQAAWVTFQKDYVQIIELVLSGFDLKEVKSLNYQLDASLDVGMTFEEMSELGASTFFSHADDILHGMNDWAISYVRDSEGEQYRLDVSVMGVAIALNQLKQSLGVSSIREPAIWTGNFRSIIESMDSDRLFVRCSITKNKINKHDVIRELKASENDSIQLVDSIVRKVKQQI